MLQPPENYKQIIEDVDDGSYFKNALDWYIVKFCRPLTERIFWFFSAGIFLILIYNLYAQTKAWYPLKISRPIVLVNHDARFKQVVHKMENPYRNADYAILSNLLGYYVKMREEFLKGSLDLLKVDNRLRKVSNNSSREVAKDYQKIFDIDDLKNPLKRLGKAGSRKVTITNIDLDVKELSLLERLRDFNKLIAMPRTATVSYRVEEQSRRRNKTENWIAKIKFNYAGVIIDKENNNLTLTGFTVTNYNNIRVK